MQLKIAIIGANFKGRYSGGRIHALVMAHALAANGYHVDYYTNVYPVFASELKESLGAENLNIKVQPFFAFRVNTKYNLVIVVPHLASRKSFIFDRYLFYPLVKRVKAKSACPLWFLDFESPNWIEEMTPEARPSSAYQYSNQIIPYTNAVLSTTKTGVEYARAYYTPLNPNLKFLQLYAAINSVIADKVSTGNKENKIIYFGRFGEKHKNSEVIVDIIQLLPHGFSFVIIGNRDKIPQGLLEKVYFCAEKQNVDIRFLSGISDFQKYQELATSKFLIYSSSFEGYGLPPIEAQYVGTPTLCSDLPVLREVNSEAEFVDFNDLEGLKSKINKWLNKAPEYNKIRQSVAEFASFEVYKKNIKQLIECHLVQNT